MPYRIIAQVYFISPAAVLLSYSQSFTTSCSRVVMRENVSLGSFVGKMREVWPSFELPLGRTREHEYACPDGIFTH
jgi:hypothetical protein